MPQNATFDCTFYAPDYIRPWLNWIEYQIPILTVAGSIPVGRAKTPRVATLGVLLIHETCQDKKQTNK